MLRNLKLRQLRLLVTLDSERKLHVAADRLNMSQSAASKMLTEIEATAKVPLFERTARGVQPTAHGEILIRGARAVIADIEQASTEFIDYAAGGIGTATIGVVAGAAVDLAIEIIQDLGNKLAKLKVQLMVNNSAVLVERLNAYHCDFVIARVPIGVDTVDLEYIELGSEDASFLVRSEHPLLKQKIVQLEETRDLQWICEPRGSFIRQNLEQLFLNHGLCPPRPMIDTVSYIASIGIAARIDAIVPVPSWSFDLVDPKRFGALPIPEKLAIGAYGLIKLKHRRLRPAAQVIYDIAKRLGLKRPATSL